MHVRSLVRVLSILATVVAALGATASTAAAYGTPVACTARNESQAFKQFGDDASYFLVPNGGFEGGAANWALSGSAQPVVYNEPWRVNSPSDLWGLQLGQGAVAESRTFCVTGDEKNVRLFLVNPAIPGSSLQIELIAKNPSTGQSATSTVRVAADPTRPFAWTVSRRLDIPGQLGTDGTQYLTVRISVVGGMGVWIIDDVFVDPVKLWR